MGDGLFHDGRVDRHALQARVVNGSGSTTGFVRQGNAPPGPFQFFLTLRQQPLNTFFTNPIAPARQRRRVDRRAMLKECLTREVLVAGVLDPSGDHGLVRQPIGGVEIRTVSATTRGWVVGRPIAEGRNPDHFRSNTSQ